MPFPDGLPTRYVSTGAAFSTENGDELVLEVVTRAFLDAEATVPAALVYEPLGIRLESFPATHSLPAGEQVWWEVPCTDVDGYLDGRTGAAIVLGEDEHAFVFRSTVTVKRAGELVSEFVLGPYVVPDGEGVLDLDTGMVTDPVTGIAMPLPELWQQIIADAESVVNLKGAPGGVAELDAEGTVPQEQLPEHLAPAALNTAIVHTSARPTTAVLIGDSHFQRGGGLPINRYYTATAPFNWANSLLGYPFNLLANLAVGGKRTDQIIADQLGPALALNPGWVFVVGGTNDPSNSTPASQTIANLGLVIDTVVGAGAMCVISTVPPVDSMTTSDKTRLSTINNWIRAQGRYRRNVIVVDAWSALVDPADGTLVDNYSASGADTVHLSARGAHQWGKVMADALRPHISGGGSYARYEDDPLNLIARSHFLVPNSGNIANGPSAWAGASNMISAGCSFDWEDRDDGVVGKWLVITVPEGVGEQVLQHQVYVTSDKMRSGDEVFAMMDYEAEPAGEVSNQNFSLLLSSYDGSATTLLAGALPYNVEPAPALARKGTFRTPPATVVSGGPGGSRSMLVGISIRGAGVYKVAAAGLFNQTLYPEMAEAAS